LDFKGIKKEFRGGGVAKHGERKDMRFLMRTWVGRTENWGDENEITPNVRSLAVGRGSVGVERAFQ